MSLPAGASSTPQSGVSHQANRGEVPQRAKGKPPWRAKRILEAFPILEGPGPDHWEPSIEAGARLWPYRSSQPHLPAVSEVTS